MARGCLTSTVRISPAPAPATWGSGAAATVGVVWALPHALATVVMAGTKVHQSYVAADDRWLKFSFAILGITVLHFSPWLSTAAIGFPTEYISAYSTEFLLWPTAASVNVVGVFNSFAGTTLDNASRITVGPDTFADISLISPEKFQPHWNRVTLPPMGVPGIGGQAPAITEAVQVPLQLQWGAKPVYVYAYI